MAGERDGRNVDTPNRDDELRAIKAALDGFRQANEYDCSGDVAGFLSSCGGTALKFQIMSGLGIGESAVTLATKKLSDEGRIVLGYCKYKNNIHRAYRLVK